MCRQSESRVSFYRFLITHIFAIQVTKETAEIVVNEAIELWLEHGGPTGLNISDTPIKPKWLFLDLYKKYRPLPLTTWIAIHNLCLLDYFEYIYK